MFNNKQILNASSAITYQIQSGANQDENFTIVVIRGRLCPPMFHLTRMYDTVNALLLRTK